MEKLQNRSKVGVLSGHQTTVTSDHAIFSDKEWAQIIDELSLSPRQKEIIQCLLLGDSDKQIANDLHISVPTVRTHLSRLFIKLDVQDRVELILRIFYIFCKSRH